MKRKIQGVVYDTENSHLVGLGASATFKGDQDPAYWRATLYRTPKAGRFFLAGEGGFLTRFHSPDGQARVVRLSAQEARAFALAHLSREDLAAAADAHPSIVGKRDLA